MDCLSNIGSCNGKLTVAMSAEDIIRFLLSDFKGQFDEIFERTEGDACQSGAAKATAPAGPAGPAGPAAPAAPPRLRNKAACPRRQRTPGRTLERTPEVQELARREHAPRPSTPPPSPRKLFAAACIDRMRELEQSFSASAELQADGQVCNTFYYQRPP